ncbi:MAG: hypothetical protein KKC77_19780, partial [Proteobacteria bacterium]|nr:hypothetical protein [Pseudomonadota bacterium]
LSLSISEDTAILGFPEDHNRMKCPYNRQLNCKYKTCPIQDDRFWTALVKWAENRNPRAINWDSGAGYIGLSKLEQIAETALLFSMRIETRSGVRFIDLAPKVLKFFGFGLMTYRTCVALRSGYQRWKKRMKERRIEIDRENERLLYGP